MPVLAVTLKEPFETTALSVTTRTSFTQSIPDTGRPYDVWHVNNSVDPLALQDGTFENPFMTMAQAEAPVSKEHGHYLRG